MLSWGQLGVEKLCKYTREWNVFIPHLIIRLLDILAGHKSKKGVTGQVLINGRPQPVNFRCEAAYVVQVGFILCSNNYLAIQATK